ncbi:MAG: site-specific integrase [Caulobacter sp.]|nr:site-specific integrase [Caulobacter sp.]
MNLTQLKSAPEGSLLKDDEVTGLEFRVRDGRRAFFFYYRVKGTGQRRRPKVGDFPAMTIQQAREIARGWYAEVQQGKDPSGAVAVLRASETVEQLCDRYLAEHETKRSHRHEAGRVKNWIKPEWGKLKAASVGKQHLAALKADMADKPVAFNRLQALVSTMWKWGGYSIETVKRYPETKRQRYLSDAEKERLEEAFDAHEIQYPHAIALLRVLYLTGARFSEIKDAKRSQFRVFEDADGRWGELTLPRHKGDEEPKVIAFPAEAVEVVESVSPRRGALVGLASYPWMVWEKVRKQARLKNFKLHDKRHSFASDALSEGATLGELAEVLGHANLETTRRYAHLATKGKRKIVNKVAAGRRKP